MDFMEQLDKILESKGIKAVDLASAIGVGAANISAWRRRNSIPTADIVLKIADYLDTSVRYLVTGEDEQTQLSPKQQAVLRKYADIPPDKQKAFLTVLDLFSGTPARVDTASLPQDIRTLVANYQDADPTTQENIQDLLAVAVARKNKEATQENNA